MKKKFINGILMVAMLFAATSSFVSCKDNVDDDISPIYAQLSKKSAELQDKINSLHDDLQNQIDQIEPLIINYGDTTIKYVTELITFNVDSICNDYNTKIEVINKNLETKIEVINEDLEIINQQITNQSLAIDEINNNLSNISNRIDAVGDSVSILWARVDSIAGILDALVNGNLIVNVVLARNK